jgi:hypothetical protein
MLQQLSELFDEGRRCSWRASCSRLIADLECVAPLESTVTGTSFTTPSGPETMRQETSG